MEQFLGMGRRKVKENGRKKDSFEKGVIIEKEEKQENIFKNSIIEFQVTNDNYLSIIIASNKYSYDKQFPHSIMISNINVNNYSFYTVQFDPWNSIMYNHLGSV